MDIDDVANELYGGDPADFIEVRKARAAQARKEGDRELATEIGKFRKPTTVGWLVNLLAWETPDDIDAVLQLGAALREAQRHLSGAELRRLTTQRQQIVRKLARKAGELAQERGRDVGEDALREVGQTLHAAMADDDIAEQVRLGRIVTAANYEGFGPAGLTVVGGKAPERVAPKPKRDRSALLEATRAELDEATAALTDATTAAASAQEEAAEASAAVEDVEQRIAELKDELERAEQERQFARSAEKVATDTAKRADRDLERAQQWETKVRRMFDDLSADDSGSDDDGSDDD
ncbi:hypothetical protein [Antrihabitans spumae]|uniref:Transposase n=1 Tax=Antrihabitans spumae TaxID=3373370 RepID=A0ABW7KML6_9NOCA